MALIEDLECITKIFYGIFSARDNLSLWVIGPSVGQFIAGIRQVLHPSSYYGSNLMKVSGILENLIVQEFPRRKLCPRSWLRVEVRVNVNVIITIIIIIITIIIIIIITILIVIITIIIIINTIIIIIITIIIIIITIIIFINTIIIIIITIIIIIITIIIIIIISMDVNMLHTGTRAGPDFGRITTLLFQSPATGSTKHDVNGLKWS